MKCQKMSNARKWQKRQFKQILKGVNTTTKNNTKENLKKIQKIQKSFQNKGKKS